jgi:protein ImuA
MRSPTPLPQPTALIYRLRASIERATAGWAEYVPLLDLGIAEIDASLGGGLACGALHEIAAVRETEIPAATGFALALTARATKVSRRVFHQSSWPCLSRPSTSSLALKQDVDARNKSGHDDPKILSRKAVFWIAEDICSWENGAPYGPGLDVAGISPEQLIMVKAGRARDVLWAMEEALRCRAVCAVIGEVRAQSIDQVATRRLSLAAAAGNTLGLLLRPAPDDEPAAFATRWIIGAAPSLSPLPAAERWPCLGPPRLTVRLLRNRRGHVGAWILEWNSVEQRFELATYSEPLAQPAVDRPHRAAVA